MFKKFSLLTLFIAIGFFAGGRFSSESYAQSSWEQCSNGTEVVRCETYDCPQGDTNGDGSCTLEDSGARLTDVRNDSFCANPISGCGEVRYYPSGNVNACQVRAEENSLASCDLFSVSTTAATPRPTSAPTSTSVPGMAIQCRGLTITPKSGRTPLETEIEVRTSGAVANIEEYEFNLTLPDGKSKGTVVQKSNILKQTFKEVGDYQVEAVIIDKDGKQITSSACSGEVEVLSSVGRGGGGDKDDEVLPETGSEIWIAGFLIITGLIGVYMYEKYRYI